MFFRWEHKPEAPGVGGRSCPRSLSEAEAKWALSSNSSRYLSSVSHSRQPLQEEEETPLCVGCSRITLITAGFRSNLQGSQVLLCSCWKPGYLFIMLERSLQYQKEMLPSAEFCFLRWFIWIPCGFAQASLSFLFLSVKSQVSTPFCGVTPSGPWFLTQLPLSGLP